MTNTWAFVQVTVHKFKQPPKTKHLLAIEILSTIQGKEYIMACDVHVTDYHGTDPLGIYTAVPFCL